MFTEILDFAEFDCLFCAISSSTQGLFLAILSLITPGWFGGLCGIPRTEPSLAASKTSTLYAILFL